MNATSEFKLRKRVLRDIQAFGISKKLSEWSRECGLSTCLLYNRTFIAGWKPELAMTTPRKLKNLLDHSFEEKSQNFLARYGN